VGTTLKEDLMAFRNADKAGLMIWLYLAHPRFHPIMLLRMAQFFTKIGLPLVGRIFSYMNMIMFGADIGLRTKIGGGFMMPHPVGVVIGQHSVVGRCVTIHQGVTLGSRASGYEDTDQPTICDRAELGTGSKILGGVTVGEAAVVAANSVVLHDVEPGSTVAGAPARVITSSKTETGGTAG
jgi:serine O-acetyltransferase